jgi:hypothetical protein
VKIHLSEPEEVEVVDEEGGDEDSEPPGGEQRVQRGLSHWVVDPPHEAPDWLPLPEEEQQGEARGEYVRAALGSLGHDARPPALEGRARHHAVLQGEDGKEQHVDDDADAEWTLGWGVDRARHPKAADEPDCIKEGRKEACVRDAEPPGSHPAARAKRRGIIASEVFGLPRNWCSASSERVFAFSRNQCSASIGMTVRLPSESAMDAPRIPLV